MRQEALLIPSSLSVEGSGAQTQQDSNHEDSQEKTIHEIGETSQEMDCG